MLSERDIFKLSGPLHLKNTDWSDPHHRRCVMASLVQGVYVQERNQQENGLDRDIEMETWWTFFNFKILHHLFDIADGSIFGAVYKSNKPATGGGAPEIVVAFRGTIRKVESLPRDLLHNFNILTNDLHSTSRFQTAFKAVKTEVRKHGCENVWIAGHSLGAAIGMLVGRKMAEEQGQFLQAHLFNPPFVSPPVERIKNESLKRGLQFGLSVVTAGLAVMLHDDQARIESHKALFNLRSWVPCVYVNPMDDLCSGYVGYFATQQVMSEIGAVSLASLAAQYSITDFVLSAFGKESKAGHFIPSARLAINLSPTPDFKTAHGIHQWWAPNIAIQCTEYSIFTDEALTGTLGGRHKSPFPMTVSF